MHRLMHCFSLLQVEELERVKVELERERKYTAELLEQVSACVTMNTPHKVAFLVVSCVFLLWQLGQRIWSYVVTL